jgi:hypothetical protein
MKVKRIQESIYIFGYPLELNIIESGKESPIFSEFWSNKNQKKFVLHHFKKQSPF